MAWLKPVTPALGSPERNERKRRARLGSLKSIENDIVILFVHFSFKCCVLSSERFFPLLWVSPAHTELWSETVRQWNSQQAAVWSPEGVRKLVRWLSR